MNSFGWEVSNFYDNFNFNIHKILITLLLYELLLKFKTVKKDTFHTKVAR